LINLIANLPNIISFIRILVAPIFFLLLISKDYNNLIYALILYILASISDFLDGWLARKYKITSKFGIHFDPFADKILVLASLLAFVVIGILELWMVLIIAIRDLGTTFLRIISEKKKFTMQTSNVAKWKTSLQMIFVNYLLIILLLSQKQNYIHLFLGINTNFFTNLLNSQFNYFALLFLVLLSLWTLIEYFFMNKSRFLAKN